MPRTIVALVGLLLAACGSTAPPPQPYAPRPVVEVDRWQIRIDGAPVGHVVQLEIRDPSGPLAFYRVLDADGRWLGHATMQGRFSRRVPFQEGEQDLGVWPMARGVAKLFEATSPAELRPVAVEADARRR
jgi:hypothetical protein